METRRSTGSVWRQQIRLNRGAHEVETGLGQEVGGQICRCLELRLGDSECILWATRAMECLETFKTKK